MADHAEKSTLRPVLTTFGPSAPAGHLPQLPDGLRIYTIGDIHACVDLLTALLDLILADIKFRPAARSVCVFLGDYIDRGVSARETIETLIDFGKTHESIFLKGNHELIAIKCLTDRNLLNQWQRLGGTQTLSSYKIPGELLRDKKKGAELQAAFHRALPQQHLRFFRNLLPSFTCGDFFFAHAGVRPKVDLKLQVENDLLWIRDEFLTSKIYHGKMIVHGHTPTVQVERLPNRINIDTGAFATGRLTCLVIEGSTMAIMDTSNTPSQLSQTTFD